MDLFQRMNPFRPPTRQSTRDRDRPSLEYSSSTRPSSSLDIPLPPLPESPHPLLQGEVQSFTPRRLHAPLPITPGTSKHARTPSLLRSLAHHPSLSALRSKSKSTKKKRKSVAKGGFAELASGSSDELAAKAGAGALRRKLSKRGLKASRSVPQDLRSSEEDEEDELDFDPFHKLDAPPLPSPTVAMSHAQRFMRDRTTPTDPHHPSLSSRPKFDRSNSATPSIVVQHHDMGTPESVKIRRMKFEIEVESPGKRRGRSASTSVGMESPSKLGSASSHSNSRKHLSSPAPPSRRRASASQGSVACTQPASYPVMPFNNHFITTQHPHPVPLDMTRSPTPGSISSYYLGPHSGRGADDDFIPLSDSGRYLDDGLDMMVPQEELPVGTPGGKKADLKLGAFVDGVKRNKHAERFFSRDMYSLPISSTPLNHQVGNRQPSSSTVSSASTGADLATVERKKLTHSRRSSSPFEVKLTPTVSKRVSLDAFGGSALPIEGGASSSGQEEVLDDGNASFEVHGSVVIRDESYSSSGQDSHVDCMPTTQTTEEALATFQATTLSTINEVSSGDQQALVHDHYAQPTRYFTPPGSPPRDEPSLPPFSSPILLPRHHFSAPPLSQTRNLLQAHETYGSAASDEVRAARLVIEELQSESRRLRDAMEEESEEKRQVLLDLGQVQLELLSMEKDLHSKDTTVSQLRKALADNEQWFDQMHYDLDEALQKVATLEQDKTSLLASAEQQTNQVTQLESELGSLRELKQDLEGEKTKSQEAIHELQCSLADVEAQLEATVDEYTALLSSHGADLAEARNAAFEKESLLLIRTDELRMQTDRVDKLESELKTANLILTSKDGTISGLKDKVTQLRFESNEKMFESAAQINGLKSEIEEKNNVLAEVEEEVQGLRDERERSDRERGELLHAIHALREDEESVPHLRETIADLESRLSTADYQVQSLEAELEDRSSLLQSRSLLSTSQGGEIAQLRNKLADAEDALASARHETIRRQREHQAAKQSLEAQCAELQEQLRAQSGDYTSALVRAETEQARSHDVKSRLDSIVTELDRVTLSETTLQDEVASLRRQSALDEMARLDLQKQVKQLETDKELLNVALESKQTELALTARKSTRATPPNTARTSSTRALVSSTTKSIRGGIDANETPLPSARLASSLSASTSKASRRESSIIAPSPASASRPRPLGVSTQHNRTPEKQRSSASTTAKIIISTSVTKPRAATPGSQSVVSRRSSLPVLRRQPSVSGGPRVTDVKEEEEEDLFA